MINLVCKLKCVRVKYGALLKKKGHRWFEFRASRTGSHRWRKKRNVWDVGSFLSRRKNWTCLGSTKCYKLKFGRKVDYFREWLEILIPQTADQHYLGGCAFFCPHVSHPLFLAIFVTLNQNETNNETKKLEEVIFFMKPHRDGAQMCLSTKKQHFTN